MNFNVKKRVLPLVTLCLTTSFSLAQIDFEQVLPLPPSPTVKGEFKGIKDGSLAYGDIDNDGDLDILYSGAYNSFDQTIQLYLNNGNGSYDLEINHPFPAVTNGAVKMADIDNDLDLDVLIFGDNNEEDETAELFLNDGNGHFEKVFSSGLSWNRPTSIHMIDLNDDTYIDVMMGSELFVNSGEQSFYRASPSPIPQMMKINSAFADLDGDGDQDLVVAGINFSWQASTDVYINAGNGSFSKKSGNTLSYVDEGAIAFADVDLDNDMDLLLTGSKKALLYLNDGQGIFTTSAGNDFLGVASSACSFQDVDGDNDPDLLIGGEDTDGNSTCILYLNDGMGIFSKDEEASFRGIHRGSIDFLDIDNDGDFDLFITGLANYAEICYLYVNVNMGKYELATGSPFIGLNVCHFDYADIDGDNKTDILISGIRSDGSYSADLYKYKGYDEYELSDNNLIAGAAWGTVTFEDVDKDGDQDVLFTGKLENGSKSANLYINDGTGQFEMADPFFDPVYASSAAFADVDMDGDQDVIIAGYKDDGPSASLYLNDGAGAFSKASGDPFIGVGWCQLAFADVDGDEDPDVVITGRDKSGPSTTLYLNDGQGAFTYGVNQSIIHLAYSALAFEDLNGDGDLDLIISGEDENDDLVTMLYENDGLGAFSEVFTFMPGLIYPAIDLADVDQDGDPDLIISGRNEDDINQSYFYLNNGEGHSFSEINNHPFAGCSRGRLAFFDMDQDNDPDLMICGVNQNENRTATLYRNKTILSHLQWETNNISIELFPNPSNNGVVHIKHPGFGEISVNIFDTWGRQIQRVEMDGSSSVINTQGFAPGSYYLYFISENAGITVVKLVVE